MELKFDSEGNVDQSQFRFLRDSQVNTSKRASKWQRLIHPTSNQIWEDLQKGLPMPIVY